MFNTKTKKEVVHMIDFPYTHIFNGTSIEDAIIKLKNQYFKILRDLNILDPNRCTNGEYEVKFEIEAQSGLSINLIVYRNTITEKIYFDNTKDYAIKQIDPPNGPYLILSVNYFNPMVDRKEVEQLLKNIEYKGEIFFDLLLCTGNNYNRFFKGFFYGNTIDNERLFNADKYTHYNLRRESSEFYKRHYDVMIKHSILTDEEKESIKNGEII
jgi:hypothetical protein